MELIKLWCEKIYWYKVKPIYVVKKTKSNWLKSDLLRKHLTSSHSYPLITKSDFGKIPLTHSSYIHKLSYMCFVQELSLNTAKRPLHTQPKRHTFEALSPCSLLSIVGSPINTILTRSSAPHSWFHWACLTYFHMWTCLMFTLTGFLILKLLSNPWDNLDAFLGLKLGNL